MASAPGPAAAWRLRAGTPEDATACAALIAAFQRELTDDPGGRGAGVSCAESAAVVQQHGIAFQPMRRPADPVLPADTP